MFVLQNVFEYNIDFSKKSTVKNEVSLINDILLDSSVFVLLISLISVTQHPLSMELNSDSREFEFSSHVQASPELFILHII